MSAFIVRILIFVYIYKKRFFNQSKHKAKTENWISGEQASQISDIWDILSNLEDLNIFIIIIINNMRRDHLSVLDLRNMVTTAIEEGCRKQEKGRKPWVAFISDNLWLKLLMLKRGCDTRHLMMAVLTPELWRRLANVQESAASQTCCMLIARLQWWNIPLTSIGRM